MSDQPKLDASSVTRLSAVCDRAALQSLFARLQPRVRDPRGPDFHGTLALNAVLSALQSEAVARIYTFWTICAAGGDDDVACLAASSCMQPDWLPIFCSHHSLFVDALTALRSAGALDGVRVLASVPTGLFHAELARFAGGADRLRLDVCLACALPASAGERLRELTDAALAAQLPAGAELGPLRASDAETVRENWSYGAEVSLAYVQAVIANCVTRCVRVDGVLASWLVRHETGDLGMATTLPAHRRKGLLSLCAKSLLAAVVPPTEDAARELPVVAYIAPDNAASLALFGGLGFEPVLELSWTMFTA